MVWSGAITPRDRQLVDDLAKDPAGINAVEYADWVERPEVQRVLNIWQHLQEMGARRRADNDWRFAIDALKATIDANKNLADPVQRRETRQAATTIIRFATAILTGDRRFAPHRPDPFLPFDQPRGPRDSNNGATSNGSRSGTTNGALRTHEPETRTSVNTGNNEPEARAREKPSIHDAAPSRNASPTNSPHTGPRHAAPLRGVSASTPEPFTADPRGSGFFARSAMKRSPANLVAAAGAPGPAP